MPTYTVGDNDSIASIAKDNGYLWKTIWDHGNNAALKAKRKNPNQLVAGDEVFLPDKGSKSATKPVDGKHHFTRKGEPTKFKLKLSTLGEARSNEPYTLAFGDQVIHGTTDGEGRIEHFIPGETRSATLSLSKGREVYAIALGELDPIDRLSGIQQRLSNLGYACDVSGELDDGTRAALQKFQQHEKLKDSGEPDAATKARLQELHV
ncbi:MAG: peptidoglycan-binding protein [Solimonas sp.]